MLLLIGTRNRDKKEAMVVAVVVLELKWTDGSEADVGPQLTLMKPRVVLDSAFGLSAGLLS